jgi:hypothetical protein
MANCEAKCNLLFAKNDSAFDIKNRPQRACAGACFTRSAAPLLGRDHPVSNVSFLLARQVTAARVNLGAREWNNVRSIYGRLQLLAEF